ncbi:hypothetical protein QQF64_003506 [Cirrhinus molitorella]|uniref:Uncharacterized protein n=1 Tax=Cirrhinus molitorella TaxID=172907 RepID=A0ABR3MLH2_9TELE
MLKHLEIPAHQQENGKCEVSVAVRKGVIAGILQPADVVQTSTAELPPTDSCPTAVPSHLQQLYAVSTRDLREAEQCELAELLHVYGNVFSTGPTDLCRTNRVQHDIQTRPGPPVKQQPRRIAFEKQQSADKQIQQNLDAGLASPSNSCWTSPPRNGAKERPNIQTVCKLPGTK